MHYFRRFASECPHQASGDHRQRTSRIKNKGMVKYCRVIESSPGGRPSSCELQSLLLYLTHICRWWQRGNTGKTARRVGGSPPMNQPQKKYTNGQNWKQRRWALSGYNIVGVTRRDCLLMSQCRWPWWGQNSTTFVLLWEVEKRVSCHISFLWVAQHSMLVAIQDNSRSNQLHGVK